MKVLIDITEDTYNSVCNESMLPPNVKNVIEGIKGGQLLPKDATNGDIIKTVFPEYEETRMCGDVRYGSKEYANLEFVVDEDWWDTPYKPIKNLDNGDNSGLEFADMPTLQSAT